MSEILFSVREMSSSSFLLTRPCARRLFPVASYKRPEERETFADVREVKKKTLEVLKNISTEKISRNVFCSGKNVGTSISS